MTSPPRARAAADWLTTIAGSPAAGLVWADPPPPRSHATGRPSGGRRRRADLAALPDRAAGAFIAGRLRAMPHRWAIVYTGDHFSALHLQQYIKFGRVGFHYAGHYTAVLRVVDAGPLFGATDLYARYVGAGGGWKDNRIH